MHSSKFC